MHKTAFFHKIIVFTLFFGIIASQFSGAFQAEAAWTPPLTVQSDAVYLVNDDTGTVIYAKNEHKKVFPASITKLMTAILVAEKYENSLNTQVTILHEDIDPLYGTDSSSAGLVAGETLTVEQLLYCLLLPSSNETANALARVTAGSTDEFVNQMNAKAQKIGAKDTHYVNPHGLHDPNHYTTAYDTYLISRYAMQIPILKKIVSTYSYSLPQTNKHPARNILNTNDLIRPSSVYYYKYCGGIKTGTTSQAGTCLSAVAVKNTFTYYCITMGGPIQKDETTKIALSETKQLFQWALSSFQNTTLISKKEFRGDVKVDLAWNKDSIHLYPDQDFTALIPSDTDLKTLKVRPNVPASVMAPVKAGQKIGTADVMLGNQKIGTINLISKESVARSGPLYFLYLASKFFASVWFKVTCVLLMAAFLLYLILIFLISRRKRKINTYRMKKYRSLK